ncbi:LAFE_0H04676g1_1 [Lachancea fermentati]|uniref:Pre-mRNA-splicing factor CWC2 n=1 Tax=Lachancea fermentati TaxID=4955 RepID=A0A1G4MJH6_LACFM|nr:LAFE_0H04676g1_1 [Lachancea fermentati]
MSKMPEGNEFSWKKRPAVVQVKEADLPSSIPAQTGLTFNVWYNRWSQGNSGKERFVNPYRLEPELHEGLTSGDKAGQVYFCLYFSKGMCCRGKKCDYLHHIPTEDDIVRLSLKSDVLDCFGREKFADYREDMGGVGSFRKKNRTLYIGGIAGALNNKQLKSSQIENRIRFVFGKLGAVERVRYVEAKNCAFVKYKHQANAEFSKEAMSNQTLLINSDKEWAERSEGSGLLVKWANDDPNPEAQRREKIEQEEESLQVMLNLLKKSQKVITGSTNATAGISSLGKKRLLEPSEAVLENQTSIFRSIPVSALNKLKKRKQENTNTLPQKERVQNLSSLVDYPSSEED